MAANKTLLTQNNEDLLTQDGELLEATIPTFTITVIAEGPGTVTGGGTYEHGDICTITATPSFRSFFCEYYIYRYNTENNYISEDEHIPTDIQSRMLVSPTTVPDVLDTYLGDNIGVSNSTYLSTSYEYAKEILSTDATYNHQVTRDVVIYAKFRSAELYKVSVSSDPNICTITPESAYVYEGEYVTLKAKPIPGYRFVGWSDGGDAEYNYKYYPKKSGPIYGLYYRISKSNETYQYRCYVKDQNDLTAKPKAFMIAKDFTARQDLMSTANTTVNVLDFPVDLTDRRNEIVKEGDILVLYGPDGTNLYNGVINSITDTTDKDADIKTTKTITKSDGTEVTAHRLSESSRSIKCSQMQNFYAGNWIYETDYDAYDAAENKATHTTANLEAELEFVLKNYAAGKLFYPSYYAEDAQPKSYSQKQIDIANNKLNNNVYKYDTGEVAFDSQYVSDSIRREVSAGTTIKISYTYSGSGTSWCAVTFYNKKGEYLSNENSSSSTSSVSFTAPSDCKYFSFCLKASSSAISYYKDIKLDIYATTTKQYEHCYTQVDPQVARRLGGFSIKSTAYSEHADIHLVSEEDSDLSTTDMEDFIYDLYDKYNIIFNFDLKYSGTNTVDICVPNYDALTISNNTNCVTELTPLTEVEDTNKIVIFKTYESDNAEASREYATKVLMEADIADIAVGAYIKATDQKNKIYLRCVDSFAELTVPTDEDTTISKIVEVGSYVYTKNGEIKNLKDATIDELFNITNCEIVTMSDDDTIESIKEANLPKEMFNHKVTFKLRLDNNLYKFSDFKLGMPLKIWKDGLEYESVLTAMEFSKSANENINEITITAGKVRTSLTSLISLGKIS